MVAFISHSLRPRQLLNRLSWIRRREAILIIGALALAVWLVAPALVMSIIQAFRPPAGNLFFEESSFWGLSNFTDVYTGSRALQSTLIDTGIYTVGSVALAFVLGFALAWLVERTNLPGRDLVFVVLLFPLMMPAIVTTLGWVLLLGQRIGLINIAVRTALNWIPGVDIASGPFNLTTMYGMIVLQGFGSVTLMFIFISAALRGMDPALEEASRTSGATFLQTVRKVTIPVIRPAVLGVIILATILTIESFEVPLILSTGAKADILSTRIWELLTTGSGEDPLYGAVAAMGFHFMLLTYVMFFAYTRLTARAEQFATITGKGFPRPALRPGSLALARPRRGHPLPDAHLFHPVRDPGLHVIPARVYSTQLRGDREVHAERLRRAVRQQAVHGSRDEHNHSRARRPDDLRARRADYRLDGSARQVRPGAQGRGGPLHLVIAGDPCRRGRVRVFHLLPLD